MDAAFSPNEIAKLDEGPRLDRLQAMQAALVERLAGEMSIEGFFARSRGLIDELRLLGHDLWSFDSDGEEFESWCGDWTQAGGGGPLWITFRYPREVEVSWREPKWSAG